MFEPLKKAASVCREEIAVYRRVLSDPRTPRMAKFLLGLGVAYLVSPIDIIPDFIPGLGLIDDLLVVILILFAVKKLIPPNVLKEHRDAVRAEQSGER
jgi:uncharacterized membrane protein YkvA (DUF1232 family)